MHSNCRLLPEDMICKITQRNNISRANTCDIVLKLLNEEITSDIQKHKQNIWKEHLDAHWDHMHNTHILWKTIQLHTTPSHSTTKYQTHSIVLADCDPKATINKKPPRKVHQWSKADWQLIKEQTVIFAKQFLALALTRTVKENYTVFIEYMEGILAVNIPSKLSNSRHNLPWMNINFKRLIRKKGRRFKKAKKSGMDEDRTLNKW